MRLNLYSACLIAVFASEASALQLSIITTDDASSENLAQASGDSLLDLKGNSKSKNVVPCSGCGSSTLAQGDSEHHHHHVSTAPAADAVHNSDNFSIDGASQHVRKNYDN